MSQEDVTVIDYEEYGNTGLLKSLKLSFHVILYAASQPEVQPIFHIDHIDNILNKIVKKINFCYHHGINLNYKFIGEKISTDIYEVIIKISYDYEKSPNYYKLDVTGFLPCIPKYDKKQFEYALVHGFSPTLASKIKIVNI